MRLNRGNGIRVLVISPPPQATGGIQRYNLYLLRALKELLGEDSVSCLSLPDNPTGSKNGNFSVVTKLRFAFDALLKSRTWKPDLILCTHVGLGPIGWLTSRIARCPYWVFTYGIEAWVLLGKAKHSALVQAARVIVISSFSREQIVKRHNVDVARVGTLPCALDDELVQIPAIDDRMSMPGTGPVVMTVARMAVSERYKGHHVILRSLPSLITQFPDLVYLVVGGGDDRVNLERLAESLGVAKHVVFTGEVSDTKLVSLYRRCDVFALPARTEISDVNAKGEGFGIVYLEAMAFGKPVIGPSYGAPAEFIVQGETGLLVDPLDPNAVAAAIRSLFSDLGKARAMGERGKQMVTQSFSYSSFRNRLENLLSSEMKPAAARE